MVRDTTQVLRFKNITTIAPDDTAGVTWGDWFQVYIDTLTPPADNLNIDWNPVESKVLAHLVWGGSAGDDPCNVSAFDGTLNSDCGRGVALDHPTTLGAYVPAFGDYGTSVDVWFVIKVGLWTDNLEKVFATTVLVDNVSLLEEGSIGIDDTQLVFPSQFALQQNYPNPFNPTTTIEYTLDKPSDVKLTVYNVLGRQVATLVDEHQSKDSYSIVFDGTNLSSGIYFYRLETGLNVLTRKMVLLK